MPSSPTPAPPQPTSALGGVLGGTWTMEKRQLAGIGLGLLCLGIIVGFRMAQGGRALIEEAQRGEAMFVPKAQPCADCAEREIQRQRARPADRPLPGNVPPSPAAGDPVVSPESSGMMTDTSKGYVADPTFIGGGGDASAVPGM